MNLAPINLNKYTMKIHYVKQLTSSTIYKGRVQRTINPKGKYWDENTEFTYSFIGGQQFEQEHTRQGVEKIKNLVPGLKLTEVASGGNIRISFDPNAGSYSYVGTDNLYVDPSFETMNLGWQESTHRVVIHEFAHAIFNQAHEHAHPDVEYNWPVLYSDFESFGWDKGMVDNNFRLEEDSHDITEIDEKSIMLYYLECKYILEGPCGQNNEVPSVMDVKRWNELYPSAEPVVVEEEKEGCMPKFLLRLFPSKTRLGKLTEVQLVLIANELGIEATRKDLKNDTLIKIWQKLQE